MRPNTMPGPFPSDLKSMWPVIQYEERVFESGLNYNTTTKKVLWDQPEGKPKYAGLPSDDIDEAWEHLLKGMEGSLVTLWAITFD